jgi:hypothetical protein
MGLALDEPTTNDEKFEVKGISFVMTKDVVETLQYYGSVVIDYLDKPFFMKGFQVSLSGASSCS